MYVIRIPSISHAKQEADTQTFKEHIERIEKCYTEEELLTAHRLLSLLKVGHSCRVPREDLHIKPEDVRIKAADVHKAADFQKPSFVQDTTVCSHHSAAGVDRSGAADGDQSEAAGNKSDQNVTPTIVQDYEDKKQEFASHYLLLWAIHTIKLGKLDVEVSNHLQIATIVQKDLQSVTSLRLEKPLGEGLSNVYQVHRSKVCISPEGAYKVWRDDIWMCLATFSKWLVDNPEENVKNFTDFGMILRSSIENAV
jgi:hypothetical protein